MWFLSSPCLIIHHILQRKSVQDSVDAANPWRSLLLATLPLFNATLSWSIFWPKSGIISTVHWSTFHDTLSCFYIHRILLDYYVLGRHIAIGAFLRTYRSISNLSKGTVYGQRLFVSVAMSFLCPFIFMKEFPWRTWTSMVGRWQMPSNFHVD